VIRWISGDYTGPALPNYVTVKHDSLYTFGIHRIDHIVCNVPNLFEAVDYLMKSIGFHEFSEFTAEDIGTLDSGLNSMVVANNNEYVLMPVNEPTFGFILFIYLFILYWIVCYYCDFFTILKVLSFRLLYEVYQMSTKK
jgi:hypothetical protein